MCGNVKDCFIDGDLPYSDLVLRPGKQPRIISASTRQKVDFFGAINVKTGKLVTKKALVFNADTFGDFLIYLLVKSQGKLFLILDNVTWHKARDLQKFFLENRNRLVDIFLPPYSAQLNPIKRVRRITRRQVTHNRYLPSIEDLEAALMPCFAKWEQVNNALKALYANI